MDQQLETISGQQGEWVLLAPAAIGVSDQQAIPVWGLVLAARDIPYYLEHGARIVLLPPFWLISFLSAANRPKVVYAVPV